MGWSIRVGEYDGHMAVYLDHAATTPMLESAIAALTDQMKVLGNPSSLHASGRRARMVVEEAREMVAEALHARPADVVFTAGGTEANNLAIKGLYWARSAGSRRRILAGATEHHAVMDPVEWLGAHGAEVSWIPVSSAGVIDVEWLRASIESDPESVALVSVMWANNEMGAIAPIREIAALCAQYEIPFHTDAVQATAWLDVSFDIHGLTALTVSGHKVGGPHSSGALLLSADAVVVPVLHGGGQERDVRSGTLDAASAISFATALRDTVASRSDVAARVQSLRDELIERVQEAVPEAVLNGPLGNSRLANNSHFSFPGCEGDALLMLLDAAGVECSTGSACTAGIPQPSHVLLAMGVEPLTSRSSLRFSLGRTSTSADVDALVAALPLAYGRALRAGLVAAR